MDNASGPAFSLSVDGSPVEVTDQTATLLDVLRSAGHTSVKDGCSPQGQCGCCTVLVDGQPRVACVTPVRRVRDRAIVTPAGLENRDDWAAAFCAVGASQCGFCTPGIAVRLEGLRTKDPDADDDAVRRALAAHLCRCTGWNTIVDAWHLLGEDAGPRDLDAASARATLEGGVEQRIDPAIALGSPVFSADTAPDDALIALQGADGQWVVGETLTEARALSQKIQGRRTTLEPHHPIDVPEGDWAATLQTTWVEPGYLETDAAWCAPNGEPASALANGGAFGAKVASPIGEIARQLADEHGRPVLALFSREDATRFGPKRPPVGAGVRADGTGVIHIARTPGIADAITAVAPQFDVVEVDVAGPPTSADIRAAGWAEAVALQAAATGGAGRVLAPSGGWAEASIATDGAISVTVDAGAALDPVMLRSYCIGAAHMATSWVQSEAMAVDPDGVVHDLTIRSFGILKASDTPSIEVEIVESDAEPVNGSDAVFAAVAAAQWQAANWAGRWPAHS